MIGPFCCYAINGQFINILAVGMAAATKNVCCHNWQALAASSRIEVFLTAYCGDLTARHGALQTPRGSGKLAQMNSAHELQEDALVPPGSVRAYWLCQIAGWYGFAAAQIGAVALLKRSDGLRSLIGELDATVADSILDGFRGVSMAQVAFEFLLLHTGALVVTHLLRRHMRQRQWQALSVSALLRHGLVAGVLLSVPFGLAQWVMAVAAIRPPLPGGPPWTQLVLMMLNWSGIFWLWIALYFAVLRARKRRHAELRRSEIRRALQLAELRLLKAQLNPHFLFNSLNSVRALIADDAARAQQAVTQLARMLRYTLGAGQDELVTLEQELEIVSDYLALEALRLDRRLRVERDISAAALRARIPVMLLQTLIENAIKHGIAELPDGGLLRLSARVADGCLQMEIENPRPDPPLPTTQSGVGLRNSVERLRLLFGAEASLEIDLAQPGRALVCVRIPLLAMAA